MRLARLVLAAFAIAFALAAAPATSAYPWPVKPFDRQHPVRAFFGEPRTVFDLPAGAGGLNGPGQFSFADGIDIVARGGTRVFPVAPGRVQAVGSTSVAVRTESGARFVYSDIKPSVSEGEEVRSGTTVLGYVRAGVGALHLTELQSGRAVNPLGREHLAPYRDTTRPTVRTITIRDADGRRVSPIGVCGTISLVANALDRPPLRLPKPWLGLPVVPALLKWSLVDVGRRRLVASETTADFRDAVRDVDFWRIYARGTYQNMPRFAGQSLTSVPGRYLFSLTPDGLDTRRLRNGVHELSVTAADTRGRAHELKRRFSVLNGRSASGGRGCPRA